MKVAGAGRFFAPDGEPRGCGWCHGTKAEGGYGPDLAGGRGLTWEQFRRAVRKPWGAMPAYTEEQLPDSALADVFAYIKAQPKVSEPGEWHWRRAPATAPLGQQISMNTLGCGQCHEPELKMPRMWMGEVGKDATFEYFAKQIYNHTAKYPRGMMPNFSKDRFPEPALREMYNWMLDIGWRASIGAGLTVSDKQPDRTTYTLNVANRGQKDKGLTAEGVTIFVRIPAGQHVLSATQDGYVGTMPLAKLGMEPALELAPHPTDDTGHVERPKVDLSGEVAVWKVAKIAAAEKLSYTLTLSGPPTSQAFAGSTIHWDNPGRLASGSPPVLVYRDLRISDHGDQEPINPPPMTSGRD
jgi:mono/diheme cytochrome c family protein